MNSEKAVLRKVTPSDRGDPSSHPDFIFFCPACSCGHGIWTTKKNHVNAVWTFNGNMDKPTFTPSLKISGGSKGSEYCCHSVVTDGVIHYCGDCTHEMAGKSVPMQAF